MSCKVNECKGDYCDDTKIIIDGWVFMEENGFYQEITKEEV